MSSYKTDQHRFVHRGKTFHFVSYEAQVANQRTGQAAVPATWFLMASGKRWPALAQIPNQDPEVVIRALTRWLDQNIFAEQSA